LGGDWDKRKKEGDRRQSEDAIFLLSSVSYLLKIMGEHYNELSAILRRVRARWRAMSALRAWTWTAAAAAGVLLVALVAHRLIAPEGPALVALWGVAVVATLACVAWLLPLRHAPADHQVARLVEECCPELEDALITAIAERDDTTRRAMLASVLADAAKRCRNLDLDRIVSRKALRKAAMSASAATVALFVLGFFSAGPATRAAEVFALYLFPERIVLEVVPGDVKLRAGQPLRVIARVPGSSGGVVPVLRYGQGKEWSEARMQPGTDGFAFSFDRVDEGFSYSVAAAAARSRDYTVTVVRPPRVERIDLHYEYPRAFGLKPRLEEDSGDIYGPVGTRVRISIITDKPVTSAALTLPEGKRITLKHGAEGAEGELLIAEDGSYRVALGDGDGLFNPGDTEYFIRTLEDRPPDVRIVRPAGDRQVTPIEEVAIEARADDDFGIATFDLVYSVRGGEEKSVPFRRDGSGMTVNGNRTVYLEDLHVAPGDFVTYYARARDVSRGKRATEARSDIFFLEVKPFEEEFVAAESQQMGGGSGDRSLDDLAEAQKEIIVATWKLDARGRNARGQSQDDIRSVARAQGELQKRAQAAAGQLNRSMMGGRRRSARPAGPTEPSTTDQPMTKAVEAMGKAVTELDALKTGGALPHEMTALNELLRAQAEVRKRQVQRQQQNAMGGRGSNRQQQDLSSLFDRELARQQQTNYETPNSSETREEKQDESSALDKIRELARRQDALNREQQELAKRREEMTEEELRRQLEKLTREQSELRREAEELARQMQQQGSQQSQQQQSQQQNSRNQQGQQQQQGKGGQGQQSQQQQNAEASRALRQASEEMQGATSDLRRQDPNQASSRGARALEKLKDLEQRMRSAQPDDRRRALGELQLESRQLADAQRQLGKEGQQPSQQNADGARRRTAEQNRLADRMQRLEQSVRQLAQGAQGAEGTNADERTALGEAARDLDRQKLSERMRNAARAGAQQGEQKKDAAGQEAGQTPQPRADGREGEEIARQLERLAERLGAATGQSAESRKLSDQLARNRELREKLNEVDRQLSEMRKKAGEQPESGRERQGRAPQGQEQGQQGQQSQSSEARDSQRGGDPQQQQGQRSPSSQGQQGETGQQGPGNSGRGGEIQRADEEGRPWDQARELIDELRREDGTGSTPEMTRFNPGISAPGTEAWKQDFTKWEELKKQMEVALEKAETTLASQLREQESKDRLNAGATQAVPDAYRRLVDKYYRALASKKKP
jgi:hypothetical protein